MESLVPDACKEAIVIFVRVLKPCIDRPQATWSQTDQPRQFLCKAVERVVNRRLVWFLESRKLLSGTQCGFRRHRSAVDRLVNLYVDDVAI
jgi:potassium voltage-gated channel Eag-related subfamily H protein 8